MKRRPLWIRILTHFNIACLFLQSIGVQAWMSQASDRQPEMLSFDEMAQIKGGNSADKEGGPKDPNATDHSKQPDRPKRCECGQKNVNDPVILTGGKNFIPCVDVSIPGPGRLNGVNLEFVRSYSNQDGYWGGAVWGVGWVTNLDIAIWKTVNANGPDTVTFRDGDGTVYRLTETSDGSHVYQDFGMTVIEQDATQGKYYLKKPFGIFYQFYGDSNGGRISTIDDRGGQGTPALTYSYNPDCTVASITDRASRSLTFSYTYGRLTTVTDPLGRQWTYTYVAGGDSQGELETVTSPVSSGVTRTVQYYYGEYVVNGVAVGHSYDANNIVAIKDAKNQLEYFRYNGVLDDGEGDRVIAHVLKDGKEITFSYNNIDGTSDMTVPGKGTWNYRYTVKGLTTQVSFTNAANRVWSKYYNYDSTSHLMTNYVDSLGNTWTYTHSTNFQLVSTTDPMNNTMSYTDDSATGKWATMTDENGHVVTRTFDSSTGNLTGFQDALTNSTSFAYTNSSLPNFVTSKTDRNSHTNSFEYNSKGDLTRYVDGNGKPRAFTYDDAGRLLTAVEQISSGTTRTTTYTYDDADRLTQITMPDQTEYHFEYDLNDNLTSKTDPLSHEWTYTYDALDRLKTVTDPLNHTTTRSDELSDNSWTITDAAGRVTNIKLDEYDRVIETSVKNGGGTYARTQFVRDTEGNVLQVIDANSHTTEFQYDEMNRLTKEIYPDSSYEEYTYDNMFNVVSYRNRSAGTNSMSYDANNRMVSKDGTDFGYDNEGNVTNAVNSVTGTFAFTYDAANRMLSASQPGNKTVSYEYYDNGLRKKLTYPDSTYITYEYNPINLLSKITDGSSEYVFDYDDAGRRTQLTYPTTLLTYYDYDDANRLTWVSNQTFWSNISTFTYTLDDVGNRTQVDKDTGSTETTGYTYDPLTYGLTGTSNSVSQTYAYDELGNRTSFTQGTNTVTYGTANNLNQYPSVGGVSFTHSTNGNLTSDGVVSMTYDTDNRLTQASKGTNTVDYTYDWMNRVITRSVGATTNRFIYDGWTVVAEVNSSGSITKKYITSDRTDEILAQKTSSLTLYFLKDGLGSTVELAVNGGSVGESYSYDAFGAVSAKDYNGNPIAASATLTKYLFAGREYQPETGLYNYRNRFYHPGVGRFLQPDPIGFKGGDWNIYSYVRNNPINSIDPLGLGEPCNGTCYDLYGGMPPGSDFGTGMDDKSSIHTPTPGSQPWPPDYTPFNDFINKQIAGMVKSLPADFFEDAARLSVTLAKGINIYFGTEGSGANYKEFPTDPDFMISDPEEEKLKNNNTCDKCGKK